MTPNPSDEAWQGLELRPFLVPCSSRSERLGQCCFSLIVRIADWRIANWGSRVRDFATVDPLDS
eukprot:11122374-Alexandrium_andersonii.AAC.1